ncbi:MAG: hypothetical protein KatS3mg125_0351 [Lysobacterales bacterium]|nr:MAG: hypothetical protein KatS3mg125_0351 [Xanthomonadales bacterium]
MCLIALALGVDPHYPLLLLANRDERYERPSLPSAPWPEDRRVLGGRDLIAGGTWLAVRSDGRFAAVTNRYRPEARPGRRSRGELPAAFILGDASAAEYLAALRQRRDDYAPFNLLLGDLREAVWFESESGESGRLARGLFTIGNGPVRTPWPKAERLLERLAAQLGRHPLAPAALLAMLADDKPTPAHPAGTAGEPPVMEQSPIFLVGERFGTRASTVVIAAADGSVRYVEQCFGPGGRPLGPPTAWRAHARAERALPEAAALGLVRPERRG